MTYKEITENLCYYDKRNPDCQGVRLKKEQPCYCDNSFRGKTELAIELLKYVKPDKNRHHATTIIKKSLVNW